MRLQDKGRRFVTVDKETDKIKPPQQTAKSFKNLVLIWQENI